MTRETAKKRLEVWLICKNCPEDKQCYDSHLHSTCEYTDFCDETPMGEAVKVAIKALEQEPKTGYCEDCISRQAALDAFGLSEKSRKYGGDHSGYDTIMFYEVQDALEALPSVQPKTEQEPKTGRWIYSKAVSGEIVWSECSECNNGEHGCAKRMKYCPNCGCRMESEG